MNLTTLLICFVIVPLVLFGIILVIFLGRQKKNQSNQSVVLQQMMSGSGSSFSMDAFYQKAYLSIVRIPIVKSYVYKIRRRVELFNNDDEYLTRKETAKIALKAIIITLIAAIALAIINKDDLFMMLVSFIGVLVVAENLVERMVTKIEDKLLKQQLELFSEVRHAFHETNMVEEAIYEASLMENYEVTLQADRIYEIMISADPEMELEKYYDVAPNRFLKAFAGVSYLTKEFGDRKVNDVSLYLKNMNNITQELQLEILKRDKIDYLFRSLSLIALAPIVCILPLKNWAVSSFAATRDFYEGKWGFLAEIGLLVLIFVCYAMLKKVKDSGDHASNKMKKDVTWQERLYRIPIIEKIIDTLTPSTTKKEYVKIRNLLRETASPLKIEWLYINRVVWCVGSFVIMLFMLKQLQNMTIKSVLYNATTEKAVFGQMSEADENAANALSSFDRFFIDDMVENSAIVKTVREGSKADAVNMIAAQIRKINEDPLTEKEARVKSERVYEQLKDKRKINNPNKAELQRAILDSRIELPRNEFVQELTSKVYELIRKDKNNRVVTLEILDEAILEISKIPMSEDQVRSNAERIYGKLVILSSQYLKWTEVLIAVLVAWFMYYMPIIILHFQKKMRAMEMEDEVMQFQTIILMLMHIERISVEYIIEWLERFANIFKEPLSTCLNNYESGALVALEQLKEDAPYKPFVRIVESLESAVENVKITDAFDELETERAFFQEKRKEANERLISRKSRIGKALGFTPMVVLFVGYLILPLIWVSVVDMGSYFNQMGGML